MPTADREHESSCGLSRRWLRWKMRAKFVVETRSGHLGDVRRAPIGYRRLAEGPNAFTHEDSDICPLRDISAQRGETAEPRARGCKNYHGVARQDSHQRLLIGLGPTVTRLLPPGFQFMNLLIAATF